MPPAYVKPYVKRQKNDTADAEAICEAVTKANMFSRQQTTVINSIRAHLAEFGIVASVGRRGVTELLFPGSVRCWRPLRLGCADGELGLRRATTGADR
jgi:hypothetical protein